jgi:protein-tyrosine phosphatase
MAEPFRICWVEDDMAFSQPPEGDDWRTIQEAGVGGVIDLRVETGDAKAIAEKNGLLYYHIPMPEGARVTSQQLLLATGAVSEIARTAGKALVYCIDGVSKSPLVCAAKMARDEAEPYTIYNALRTARPGFVLTDAQDRALTYFTEVVAD